MAITNALIKAGTNALSQSGNNALANATGSALTRALGQGATQALTRGLTGAGISTLAKSAGSTLDGILGRSSGLILPNAAPARTLGDYTKQLGLGDDITSIGSVMDNLDLSMDDVKSSLSRKNYNTLANSVREVDDINRSALEALDVTSKSNLPMLNREQYYEDTLGKVGKNGVRAADVPDYMQRHLSNPATADEKFIRGSNDEILRNLFNDETSPISELYDRYDQLAQGANANEIFTPDNVDSAIALEGDKGKEIVQDFADRAFGNKRDIPISGGASPSKNVKVGRPSANAGVEDTAVDTATRVDPTFARQVEELKAQVGSAGGGMRNGGGTPTATSGGLGDEAFNVRLKNGETRNVTLGDSAAGSTKQQRAVRKLDDMTAKGMNANTKQYRNVVGKSNSIDNYYKSVAERMRAENIDQANVAEKAGAALSLRENIKQEGLQYAEANGVTMDLSRVDQLVGLSPTQKRKLAELGLGLDDMLGGKKTVTPTQAEELYKILRQYGYDWEDSKDALTSMAGKAMKKEADAVRGIIDDTMDNINVDYKTALIEEAAKNGEDPAYLRRLAEKKDFKFSDLRKDQSDWMTIEDLSGNKIKEEPTLNVFGVDTGAQNPFTAGAQKIKEKIYERQAYGGGGAGGNTGGGPGFTGGGSGAENTINFTSPGANQSLLGNLLGKAKSGGLIGASLLGGMMLGGGGSGGGVNGSEFANQMQELAQVSTEPEETAPALTVGGYTYDELEDGYMAALLAGDTDAAKLIGNLIGMLDDKAKRYEDAKKSSGSGSGGIGDKQRAALNVLSGLMNNYQSQGPIGGRWTQFMNAISGGGYAPGIAAYDSGAQGSLGTIIKALGDTGALSEGDQKRALELLPKTTDAPEAAKMKYQQLIQILQGAGAQ